MMADVLIIGGGASALQLARHLRSTMNVILLTKSSLHHSNSYLAQGGIAAALGAGDSPSFHYSDTVNAGGSTSAGQALQIMTQEASSVVHELDSIGCAFDKDHQGHFQLGREGAHGQNRIVHGGGDQTGRRIVESLTRALPPNVTVMEHHFVFELLMNDQGQCFGARSKDTGGNIHTFVSPQTVLAAGGCGQVYACTSNAETAAGDGIALAYEAGAELIDMEYIQFHPTLLYIDGHGVGLISEAVRGEGAVLVDEDGRRIMKDVHPLQDLAPRHTTAQTIFHYHRMGRKVFLDIRGVSRFQERFPSITALCLKHDVEINQGLLPVAPGCHFIMGGVKTDGNGKTNVPGLYAIGETACTRVHGASRLASNSLLEGLVFGRRTARFLNAQPTLLPTRKQKKSVSPPDSLVLPEIEDIQKRTMEAAGIMRNHDDLTAHQAWLDSFPVVSNLDKSRLTKEQVTALFLLQTSRLITTAALERKESRGSHFRSDYPKEQAEWKDRTIRLQSHTKEAIS
ncbi:L-aspartate oxidase [Halobacillus litoralis]|uniref:L-aspartate oxidase n=1 Tax=Halobacillus litoralis TaxID=45668 RepID=UPI001CD2B1B6|nr:L-aspartate oxidase [Halobacillus litoralis]MCA1024192.1 L-aspartate oxidase [Halobacillus litoralis]